MNQDGLERQIDDQLRRAFAPLPSDRTGQLARSALPGQAPSRVPLVTLVAAAALLVVLLVWHERGSTPPVGANVTTAADLGGLWAEAYADARERGVGRGCRCGHGFDLSDVCERRYDAALDLRFDAELTLVGSYEGLPTGGHLTVLAEFDRQRVCVFVVPRAADRAVALPPAHRLQLVRREVGAFVLYGLSEQPIEGLLADFVAR